MKKMLRKIAVLVCIVTLFAAPTTALANSGSGWDYHSEPELIYRAPDNSIQAYGYIYVEHNDGTATALYDISTSDKTVFVPAGKSFKLDIGGAPNSTLRILIFGQSMYYYDYVTSGSNGSFIVSIGPNSYDDNYHIWIDAPYTSVQIYNYQLELH